MRKLNIKLCVVVLARYKTPQLSSFPLSPSSPLLFPISLSLFPSYPLSLSLFSSPPLLSPSPQLPSSLPHLISSPFPSSPLLPCSFPLFLSSPLLSPSPLFLPTKSAKRIGQDNSVNFKSPDQMHYHLCTFWYC